uniref:Uncharacterized protein n=1 Tax=Anguilla anguilla TaxID=7936 RepID=A0A0E9TU25_ANGAN
MLTCLSSCRRQSAEMCNEFYAVIQSHPKFSPAWVFLSKIGHPCV